MSKRGFTLLELLLTVIIIVSALFPLLQILSKAILASAGTESEITALNLAQSRMEDLRNLAYGNISSETKASVAAFPNFKREVMVTTPRPNLKNVKVIVYWTLGGGSENNLSFESYVANF
jgi:prepilin-type N-terminal cleavage/methylation domain-containing protein